MSDKSNSIHDHAVRFLLCLGAFALALVSFMSCSGGGSGSGSGGASHQPAAIDGVWHGTWNSSTGSSGNMTLWISQTGGSIAGAWELDGTACFSTGNFTGIVTGHSVTCQATATGVHITFVGNASGTQLDVLAGTYSVQAGGACTGDSGTITLSRSGSGQGVDVAGVWIGTWESGTGASGNMSLSVTQNGDSIAGVWGLTRTTCFSSGTFVGTVTGQEVYCEATATGVHVTFLGTVSGSMFNLWSGIYSVQAGGACTGDSGTIFLSRQ